MEDQAGHQLHETMQSMLRGFDDTIIEAQNGISRADNTAGHATHTHADDHRARLHFWRPMEYSEAPPAPSATEPARPLAIDAPPKPSFAPHKLGWAGYGWSYYPGKAVAPGSICDLESEYTPVSPSRASAMARELADERRSPVTGLGALRLPAGEESEDPITRLAEAQEAHIAPLERHERPRHLSFAATSLDHAHRHLFPEPVFDAHKQGMLHSAGKYGGLTGRPAFSVLRH